MKRLNTRVWLSRSRTKVLVAAGSLTLVVGAVRAAPLVLSPTQKSSGPAAVLRMAVPMEESASHPIVVRGATPSSLGMPDFRPAGSRSPVTASVQPRSVAVPAPIPSSSRFDVPPSHAQARSNTTWLTGPASAAPMQTMPISTNRNSAAVESEPRRLSFMNRTWSNMKDLVGLGSPSSSAPAPSPAPYGVPRPNPNQAPQYVTVPVSAPTPQAAPPAQRGSVYAGPPAYRWYGWGTTTPGRNPYAPSGRSPKSSSSWMAETHATPGAFPVPVDSMHGQQPDSQPPAYDTHDSVRVSEPSRTIVRDPFPETQAEPVSTPTAPVDPEPMRSVPQFVPVEAGRTFEPAEPSGPFTVPAPFTVPVPPRDPMPKPAVGTVTTPPSPIVQSSWVQGEGAAPITATPPQEFRPAASLRTPSPGVTQAVHWEAAQPSPAPHFVPATRSDMMIQPAGGVIATTRSTSIPTAAPSSGTLPASVSATALASAPAPAPASGPTWTPVQPSQAFSSQSNFKVQVIASTLREQVVVPVERTSVPVPAPSSVSIAAAPVPAPVMPPPVLPAVVNTARETQPDPFVNQHPPSNRYPAPLSESAQPSGQEVSIHTTIRTAYRGRATVTTIRNLTPKSLLVKFVAANETEAQALVKSISSLPDLKPYEVRFEGRVNGR